MIYHLILMHLPYVYRILMFLLLFVFTYLIGEIRRLCFAAKKTGILWLICYIALSDQTVKSQNAGNFTACFVVKIKKCTSKYVTCKCIFGVATEYWVWFCFQYATWKQTVFDLKMRYYKATFVSRKLRGLSQSLTSSESCFRIISSSKKKKCK